MGGRGTGRRDRAVGQPPTLELQGGDEHGHADFTNATAVPAKPRGVSSRGRGRAPVIDEGHGGSDWQAPATTPLPPPTPGHGVRPATP